MDFETAWAFKKKCLKKAYEVFLKGEKKDEAYHDFCRKESYWMDDYALYHACKKEFQGQSWTKWPEKVRGRDPKTMEALRARLKDEIGLEMFMQFLFEEQWHRLRGYAHSKGIRILGDMPIFISQDSADVWAHQSLFDLNKDGTPKTVAGVPPDYFSATGQLWVTKLLH